MEQKEIEKASSFIFSLQNRYQELRSKLEGIKEEDLTNNEDFKNCFKIAGSLTISKKNRDSFDAFVMTASGVDFDVDKFLNLFDVQFVQDEDGNAVPTLVVRGSDEEQQ